MAVVFWWAEALAAQLRIDHADERSGDDTGHFHAEPIPFSDLSSSFTLIDGDACSDPAWVRGSHAVCRLCDVYRREPGCALWLSEHECLCRHHPTRWGECGQPVQSGWVATHLLCAWLAARGFSADVFQASNRDLVA